MATPINPKQAALTLLNETIAALDAESATVGTTELVCILLEARQMLTEKLWVGGAAPFAPDAEYVRWLEARTFEQRQRGQR